MTARGKCRPLSDGRQRSAFRRRLLAWFDSHQRSLPWRETNDPYAVWIAETMLQQTRMETVLPYYQRWLTLFPNVSVLAAADEASVVRAWEGLGYYARARRLREAARQLCGARRQSPPVDFDSLLSLPGVGRYTAAAVASIAGGQPVAAVDGNVLRVLARLLAVDAPIDSSTCRRSLWSAAENLLSRQRPGDFNQAMMELGATICLPRKPECDRCPVVAWCRAHHEGVAPLLPVKRRAAATLPVTHVCLLICRSGRLLVGRRSGSGLWAGMWEFPRVECDEDEDLSAAAIRAGRELLDADVQLSDDAPCTLQHQVTRYRVTLYGFRCRIKRSAQVRATVHETLRWSTPEELHELPMPAPQRELARRVERHTSQWRNTSPAVCSGCRKA